MALIDREDLDEVTQYKWHAVRSTNSGVPVYYPARHHEGGYIRLHQFLMKTTDGEVVDHKNGDTMDNRKENLRVCNQSLNGANSRKRSDGTTSVFKGVWQPKGRHQWMASVKAGSTRYWLGSFKTEEEAARVYDLKVKELFGAFARPNFQEATL